MRTLSTSLCALLTICALSAVRPVRVPADPTISVKKLAPGISLTQEIDQTPPQIINVLRVDLRARGIHIKVGIGKDLIDGPFGGREEVSRAARRHGAIAAVNADYFPYTGDPLGLGIRDGELYSEPWTGSGKPGPRTAMGLLPDGRIVIDRVSYLGDLQAQDGERIALTGIDRPVGLNDTIIFTSIFGPFTAGHANGCQVTLRDVNLPVRANKTMSGIVDQIVSGTTSPAAIPTDGVVIASSPGPSSTFLMQQLHDGDRVDFVFGVSEPGHEPAAVHMAQAPRDSFDEPSRIGMLVDRPAYLWATAEQAVGGGPRLLAGGKPAIDGPEEGFGPDFTDAPYARTAAGVSSDGRYLILVTVDGRQVIAGGVTLPQLSAILQRYGASDALNFDGGGSTSMSIAGVQVNSAGSTGYERPVADMVLVYSDTPYLTVAPAPPPPAVVNSDQPQSTADSAGQPSIVVNDGATAAAAGQTPTAPDSTRSADGSNAGKIVIRVDRPGDGPVTNETPPTRPAILPQARICGPSSVVQVGSETPLRLVTPDGKILLGSSPAIIWQGSVGSGIAFVNQDGILVAISPGSGSAEALYKGQILDFPVQVMGPAPIDSDKVTAEFSDSSADHSLLTVRVTSSSGQPVSGAAVTIVCAGGTVSQGSTLTTNLDGYATYNVVWVDSTGGSVTATSGMLPSVTIDRP